MKKKSIIILIIIATIIALGFVIYYININNKENKLNKLYEKIFNAKEYICTIEDNENNFILIAKKGEKYLIEKKSQKKLDEQGKEVEEEYTSTLVKDNQMYYILHNREEYYTYANSGKQEDILLEELKTIIDGKLYQKGREKVNGRKYNYEEYDGIFIFSNEIDTDVDLKTKFYFKRNNLSYMKTVIGEKQKIRRIEIKYEVNDSLFEIPSTYAEV